MKKYYIKKSVLENQPLPEMRGCSIRGLANNLDYIVISCEDIPSSQLDEVSDLILNKEGDIVKNRHGMTGVDLGLSYLSLLLSE